MTNPAPGLLADWVSWPFTLTVLAVWALAELARFAHRWRRESRATDASLAKMDEQQERRWVA